MGVVFSHRNGALRTNLRVVKITTAHVFRREVVSSKENLKIALIRPWHILYSKHTFDDRILPRLFKILE